MTGAISSSCGTVTLVSSASGRPTVVLLPSDLIAGVEHVTGVGYMAIRAGGRDRRVQAARVLACHLLKEAGMPMFEIDELLNSHPAGDVDERLLVQAQEYATALAVARQDRWLNPECRDMVPAWYVVECLHSYLNVPYSQRPTPERYAWQWLDKQKHLG